MSVKNIATTEMLQSVKNLLSQKIAAAFPVGTIIQRNDNTSPAEIYGGTWTRIEGRFLLGVTGGGRLVN